jgi:hypothetical protein
MGTGRQNVLNAFATCGAFRELSGTLYREANWLEKANGLNKQYGKVEQINLYAHAGPESGPVFHEASPYNHNQTQFTQQKLANLRVNWSSRATARIYGCNTGVNFA